MPRCFDPAYYQQVVAVLLAGGVQARVLEPAPGAKGHLVEVTEEDGVQVLWGNDRETWAWSAFAPEGEQVGYLRTALPRDAEPDQVAMAIVQQSAVLDDE